MSCKDDSGVKKNEDTPIKSEPQSDDCFIDKETVQKLLEKPESRDQKSSVQTQNIEGVFMESNKSCYDEYIKKLQSMNSANSSINLEYHKSEIKNVSISIIATLTIFAYITIATFFLVGVCIFVGRKDEAIISGAFGAVIDIILSSLISLFNKTLKSKKSYFDVENDISKFNKVLSLVFEISDATKKNETIDKIINKYFMI